MQFRPAFVFRPFQGQCAGSNVQAVGCLSRRVWWQGWEDPINMDIKVERNTSNGEEWIDLALDGWILRLWGVGSVHLKWSHHFWCTCCSCHWCVFDDLGCIVPCSSENPNNNSRRSNTWKLFAAWSVLPIATWFGAPRRHCANLPYRRQTCHLQLGWLFIPVEAYTTSLTLESCFHSRCCWWGHAPPARAQKKKWSTYCICSTMVPFFRQRHYTHRTWLYMELGKAGHVWLKTSENITCLHRCISYTCWICSSHREFPEVLGPRTHCACGLCNQEFWGPKISGPVKDAEMR